MCDNGVAYSARLETNTKNPRAQSANIMSDRWREDHTKCIFQLTIVYNVHSCRKSGRPSAVCNNEF